LASILLYNLIKNSLQTQANMISQVQCQRQQLKILPKQIQLLNLYFLNSLELEQRIKNELEENPFLEPADDKTNDEEGYPADKDVHDFEDYDEQMYEDRPDYKLEYSNYFDPAVAPNSAIVNETTFKEDAKQQLHLLPLCEEDRVIAEYLIDILNSQGLMDRDIDQEVDDLSFQLQRIVETESINKGLEIVQSLDPIGLGSRNIQECLLLQLKALNNKQPDIKCAIALLEHHYGDLMHRKFEKLEHALKIDDEELKMVLNVIGGLKFYPVSEISRNDPKNTIIPDFIITNNNGFIQVSLYSSRADSLYVNQSLYNQYASHIGSKDRSASQYVKNKISSAEWFVNAVKQREESMLRIMQCIVEMQKDFFADGDIRLLKPMVLRNISDICGLDISTISNPGCYTPKVFNKCQPQHYWYCPQFSQQKICLFLVCCNKYFQAFKINPAVAVRNKLQRNVINPRHYF
jgi:RNA polymerase sigma-54 factor